MAEETIENSFCDGCGEENLSRGLKIFQRAKDIIELVKMPYDSENPFERLAILANISNCLADAQHYNDFLISSLSASIKEWIAKHLDKEDGAIRFETNEITNITSCKECYLAKSIVVNALSREIIESVWVKINSGKLKQDKWKQYKIVRTDWDSTYRMLANILVDFSNEENYGTDNIIEIKKNWENETVLNVQLYTGDEHNLLDYGHVGFDSNEYKSVSILKPINLI